MDRREGIHSRRAKKLTRDELLEMQPDSPYWATQTELVTTEFFKKFSDAQYNLIFKEIDNMNELTWKQIHDMINKELVRLELAEIRKGIEPCLKSQILV